MIEKEGKIVKNFLKKYGHIWILSYGFIYITWFIHLEKTVTYGYKLMYTRLDDLIPFNEYFIIPYFLWFAYVAASIVFFFFKNKQDYYKLCAFLFTGMTISLIICTIYPNGTNLRPVIDPDTNIFAAMVYRLHQTDTPANVFPSIHVFNSLGVHIAIRNSQEFKNRPVLRTLSFLLMVSIILSTVFLKQHSAVDVFGAFIMAGVLYPFVYRAETELLFHRKKYTEELS